MALAIDEQSFLADPRYARRRLARQHASLDGLQVDVQRALEEGEPASVSVALGRLSAAVEAHFTLEESTRLSAVRAGDGPNAAFRPRIVDADHDRLRAELAELTRAANAGEVQTLRGEFPIFAMALAEHEAAEAEGSDALFAAL